MLPALSHWLRARLGALLVVLSIAGCQPPAAPPAPAAAKPQDESSLGKVTLSAEQARSLALVSAPARKLAVQDVRRLHGWFLAPQGSEVTLTAPIPGLIRETGKSKIPNVGAEVQQGQKLLEIEPVLTAL